ncbi:TasA family protein [Patulibacter sp. S7RM1-6]
MLSALLSRPRRLIATLALVLAAAGVAVGSGATFTSHTANAANTFTSGTLLHSNSKAGAALITGEGLKPGDSRTGEVTIKNTGSLAGDFTVSESNASSTFTPGSLIAKVEDVTDAAQPKTLYEGAPGAFGSKQLGSFAAGESRTYRITVTLSASAPNADQGKNASADLEWNATTAS